MNKEIRLRVVVPAYRSENVITECVSSIKLALQGFKNSELVIVDNDMNGCTSEIISGTGINVIKCAEYQSAAYARNEGAKGFMNGIIVFIDSDVICEMDCIEKLTAPVINGLSDATVGNYSKNTDGFSFTQKYKQIYINNVYNRSPISLRNDFWSAICAVDAKVFHESGGFNSNFSGACGEDQEFGIRLTKRGYRITQVKDACGKHLNRYGFFKVIKNDYKKGVKAFLNTLSNKVPLSDNRHSGNRDIISVFFSVITFLAVLVLSFYGQLVLFSLLPLFLWILSRSRLLSVFASSGDFVFLFKAVPFMFLLDIVRFLCVVSGVFIHIFAQSRSGTNKDISFNDI